MPATPVTNLTSVDYAVMAIYFVVVLGVGWIRRRVMRTSSDFFLSDRSRPAWITGITFISTNLGAQEVILWWGLVMLVFGLTLLAGAWHSRRRPAPGRVEPTGLRSGGNFPVDGPPNR